MLCTGNDYGTKDNFPLNVEVDFKGILYYYFIILLSLFIIIIIYFNSSSVSVYLHLKLQAKKFHIFCVIDISHKLGFSSATIDHHKHSQGGTT